MIVQQHSKLPTDCEPIWQPRQYHSQAAALMKRPNGQRSAARCASTGLIDPYWHQNAHDLGEQAQRSESAATPDCVKSRNSGAPPLKRPYVAGAAKACVGQAWHPQDKNSAPVDRPKHFHTV